MFRRFKPEKVCERVGVINYISLGHVSSGKTTTGGYLLAHMGGVLAPGDHARVQHAKKAAGVEKDVENPYARMLSSAHEVEQSLKMNRIVTTACGMAIFPLKSGIEVHLIDAPGHLLFFSEAVGGATGVTPDVAVVHIPAGIKEFEKGVSGQLKLHVLTAIAAGAGHIIVAVTMMDKVQYDQGAFGACKAKIAELLQSCLEFAQATAMCTIVPVCSVHGQNIKDRSPLMPWWTGRTLVEAIERTLPSTRDKMPTRFAFSEGEGRKGVGVLQSGTVSVGDDVVVYPGGYRATVARISDPDDPFNAPTVQAGTAVSVSPAIGEEVEIELQPLDKTEASIAGGAVLCAFGGQYEPADVIVVRFRTGRFISDNLRICPGSSVVVHVSGEIVPATLEKIICFTDARGAADLVRDPPKMIVTSPETDDCVTFVAMFKLARPAVVAKHDRCIVCDGDVMLGFGEITRLGAPRAKPAPSAARAASASRLSRAVSAVSAASASDA